MEETVVSLETARLLKEKGYRDELCRHYYDFKNEMIKVIRIYSCGECPYCRSKTIRNSRRHTTRYCTLIKQYIKGSSIPVECTLKEQ